MFRALAVLGICIIAATGCESRRVEKGPKDVEAGNGAYLNKAQLKSRYELRLTDIIEKQEALRDIIRKVLQVRGAFVQDEIQTPVDGVIEVLQESKKGMISPLLNARQIQLFPSRARCGLTNIKIDFTPSEESDALSIDISRCNQPSELVRLVTAKWNIEKGVAALAVMDINLDIIDEYVNEALSSLPGAPDCKYARNSEDLEQISCRNVNMSLSSSEVLVVQQMDLLFSGKVLFTAYGIIHVPSENRTKAQFEMTHYRDGSAPDVKVNKVP